MFASESATLFWPIAFINNSCNDDQYNSDNNHYYSYNPSTNTNKYATEAKEERYKNTEHDDIEYVVLVHIVLFRGLARLHWFYAVRERHAQEGVKGTERLVEQLAWLVANVLDTWINITKNVTEFVQVLSKFRFFMVLSSPIFFRILLRKFILLRRSK